MLLSTVSHEHCCCSVAKLCAIFCNPRTAAHQVSLSSTTTWSLLKFMFIELVMSSKHLIFLSSPPPLALNLSQHQGLVQWVSSLHQLAKVLEHQRESATGAHESSHPEPPSHHPPHPNPLGCPSAPALSALLHPSNSDWSSISHMVIYMFQCYSLKSSHPHLLPPSPKVCSLHLCLFCCLVYRVFLNFIYML